MLTPMGWQLVAFAVASADVTDQLTQPGSLTAFVLTVIAVVAFYRGWIIPKAGVDQLRRDYEAQMRELREDRDFYRQMAIATKNHADRALDLAERNVPHSA